MAHYDRRFISELVAEIVHQAPYISWQRNYRYNFLRKIENPSSRPAVPRSLSSLPVIEEQFIGQLFVNFLLKFLLIYWLNFLQSMNQLLCTVDFICSFGHFSIFYFIWSYSMSLNQIFIQYILLSSLLVIFSQHLSIKVKIEVQRENRFHIVLLVLLSQ